MHRAVASTPRSSLPTNTLSRCLVIKFARPGSPLSRRVSPLLKFPTPTAITAAMAASSPSSQQPSVAVVTTQGCPYCRQAKADLSAAGIPYSEILITDQLDILNEIKKATGQSTVPQVNKIFPAFFLPIADSFRLKFDRNRGNLIVKSRVFYVKS